jgi:hypothetical protein
LAIKQCSRKSTSPAASRTPFGSFCGAFAEVSGAELGKAAVEPSGVKPEDVKELLSILLVLTQATLEKSPYER